MDKKKSGALPLILCFSVFLLAGVLLHLLLPDRRFSENENRYLEPAPKLSWKTLFSGSFTSDFEKYITDEFPFRDRWLDLKSRAERLSGKQENNGVFFCKNDTLITRFKEPAASAVAGSIRAVNALAEVSEAPVCLALIPSAAEVWAFWRRSCEFLRRCAAGTGLVGPAAAASSGRARPDLHHGP